MASKAALVVLLTLLIASADDDMLTPSDDTDEKHRGREPLPPAFHPVSEHCAVAKACPLLDSDAVIIAGIGDSGTRAVRQLVHEFGGVAMCNRDDSVPSQDAHAFRVPQYEMHIKYLLNLSHTLDYSAAPWPAGVGAAEYQAAFTTVCDGLVQYSQCMCGRGNNGGDDGSDGKLRGSRCGARGACDSGLWGWKTPKSLYYLPFYEAIFSSPAARLRAARAAFGGGVAAATMPKQTKGRTKNERTKSKDTGRGTKVRQLSPAATATVTRGGGWHSRDQHGSGKKKSGDRSAAAPGPAVPGSLVVGGAAISRGMRFVHVVRDGRDVAYGQLNQIGFAKYFFGLESDLNPSPRLTARAFHETVGSDDDDGRRALGSGDSGTRGDGGGRRALGGCGAARGVLNDPAAQRQWRSGTRARALRTARQPCARRRLRRDPAEMTPEELAAREERRRKRREKHKRDQGKDWEEGDGNVTLVGAGGEGHKGGGGSGGGGSGRLEVHLTDEQRARIWAGNGKSHSDGEDAPEQAKADREARKKHGTARNKILFWSSLNADLFCYAARALAPSGRYAVVRIEDLALVPHAQTRPKWVVSQLGDFLGVADKRSLDDVAAAVAIFEGHAGSFGGNKLDESERAKRLDTIGSKGHRALELFGYTREDYGLEKTCEDALVCGVIGGELRTARSLARCAVP